MWKILWAVSAAQERERNNRKTTLGVRLKKVQLALCGPFFLLIMDKGTRVSGALSVGILYGQLCISMERHFGIHPKVKMSVSDG